MKYVEYVNGLVINEVAKVEKLVLYGQNINAGSCLSGLTRNLKVQESSMVINTQNSENTLVGVGFGLMLNGISSIFFMKQLDFLLLGIDHLVNTYNIIRVDVPSASFTIMPIIVDSGYEGPQSSLNNFGDFCSIAGIQGFSCTNKIDTERVIKKYLISPGFRIIGVSQRLLRQELLDLEVTSSCQDGNYFKYKDGKDATIVCFNYSLPYGLELCNKAQAIGINASLFSVNTYSRFDFSPIIHDLGKTKKLVLFDDSKSINLPCDRFLFEAADKCHIERKIIIKRELSKEMFYPVSDELKTNYDAIIKSLEE